MTNGKNIRALPGWPFLQRLLRGCASLFLAGSLGLPAGCDNAGDATATLDGLRAEGSRLRQQNPRTGYGNYTDDEALALLLNSTQEDGVTTVREWVDQTLVTVAGETMFPFWGIRRTSAGTYEIIFIYTMMDDSGLMGTKGYSWTVDLALRLVSAPRVLPADSITRAMDDRGMRRKYHQQLTMTNQVL